MHFYLPISDFRIDSERLLKEFDSIVKPDYTKTLCYCLTTKEEYVDDPEYDFSKYFGVLYPPTSGIKLLSGVYDYELTFWPTKLKDSYMKEVSDLCCKALGLSNPRVRCSVIYGKESRNNIGWHIDAHAPARIHFALKTTQECYWQFLQKDDKVIKIFQPADGVPVYIDTGNAVHDIYVPTNVLRIHFWFQFHEQVSESRLNEIAEDSKNIPIAYLE